MGTELQEKKSSPSLEIEVAGLRFQNPVIAASGTFAYGSELETLAPWRSLGGIVSKGISLEPRSGNPGPRLFPTASGLLNSVGLQNMGVEAYIQDRLPLLRNQGTQIIVNIFGHSVDEFADLAARLDQAGGISALELNLSCPNVRESKEFSKDPAATFEVVGAVCRLVRKSRVFVKLAPDAPDLCAVAVAAEQAGADALVVANTFPAMAVDVANMRPALPSRRGGLSGPAIRPIVLRLVDRILDVVKLPVIGCGGILSTSDALEYLMLGASAVEVGTAHFIDPRSSTQIVSGLTAFLKRKKIFDIQEIIGVIPRG